MFERLRAQRRAEKYRFAMASYTLVVLATFLHLREYAFNKDPVSIPTFNMLSSLIGLFTILYLAVKGTKEYVAADRLRETAERAHLANAPTPIRRHN